MKHTSKLNALKSRKDTRWCKYIALALGCSIAAIVSLGVMENTPTVVAHDPASDQKIAAVDDQTKTAAPEPEKTNVSQPTQAAVVNQSDQTENSAVPASQDQAASQADQPVLSPVADTVAKEPSPTVSAPAESDDNAASAQQSSDSSSFVPFDEVNPNDVLQQTAQATTQPAPASPTYMSPIGSDGIWHVSYVPYWGATHAPNDGSIGLWADGWFIAHSGMLNGDTIASIPPYVEVDGQVYKMTDTWISDDSVTTEEIARARANNGIVFQTCITDSTNRLVHYEPVDGPGYPYQFTDFPYTQSDVQILGLQ